MNEIISILCMPLPLFLYIVIFGLMIGWTIADFKRRWYISSGICAAFSIYYVLYLIKFVFF